MAAGISTARPRDLESRYQVAFTDWLACAAAGRDERAARAVRACGDDLLTAVAAAATAGHVLDYDDTFSAGVAHVSAACAPAALVLADQVGAPVGAMLDAYAAGFEAMAAVAAASHPALYDAGWHPTAVCAPVGAAVVAARLLALPPERYESALALALLRAGGTRGAFGSDGKAIQVGQAAAAGVQAVLLAAAGAAVDRRALDGPLGAAIEAADEARRSGYRLGHEPVEVRVDPVARQAAHLDHVDDGLSAKFSIPYCVARTLLTGPPRVADFAALEADACAGAAAVTVAVDERLPPFGAVLTAGGTELARVPCPRGAPERPATVTELEDKVADLAGVSLNGILADPAAPAAPVLDAAGLRWPSSTG